MENQCPAIAGVPVQHWNRLYDPAKALEEGTIFPELNKTFFQAPEGSNTTLAGGMDPQLRFAQICFALDDTLLYLDTHPEDEKAKEYYGELLQRKKELKEQADCGCACAGHFDWEHMPLVWEGGHC